MKTSVLLSLTEKANPLALLPVTIEWKEFAPLGSTKEVHCILKIKQTELSAQVQFEAINQAVAHLLATKALGLGLVWKRYFLSDAANQQTLLPSEGEEAVSIVQQAPLDGTKLALWLYLVEVASPKKLHDGSVVLHRGKLRHRWHTRLHSSIGDAYTQTFTLFEHFTRSLAESNCTLERNCIRTWLFVQGVDVHYGGLVQGRKHFFEEAGLLPHTHYIASTGIEGKYTNPEVLVLMDAYSIEGIQKEQITFIKGLSHLSPTYQYGLTFERATAVDYGDRRHVFVSGTASIDHQGQVVHPLQIEKQIQRTLENIEVLLHEAGGNFSDVMHLLVYLRDTADYRVVQTYIDAKFPSLPKVYVWAPVCRPAWLIEIECMAVLAKTNPNWPDF